MTGDIPGHAAKDPPLAAQIAPQVAELHAENKGRNEIARALGVSPGTVSNAARIAGVQFDTTTTEAATRSRVAQLEEDRADLAGMSAAIAKRAGRRLFLEVGEPVLHPETLRTLAIVYGVAADKLDKLSAGLTDTSDQHETARLWVEGLGMQIAAAADGITKPDENGHYRFTLPTPGHAIPADHNHQEQS